MNKQQFCAISLPHGLCCEILDYKSDYVGNKYDFIVGINQWSKDGKLWSAWTVGGARPALDKIKPVCHPPSDLTNPITHKGETVVPIIELAKISMIGDKAERFEITKNKKYITVYFENKETFTFSIKFMSFYSTIGNKSQIAPYQLNLFQKLIEWHFNLMDESESFIDVNTLEINPYK